MKFINIQTTHHDEKLKDRMKNQYFESRKGEKNETYLQDMLTHYKTVLTQLESTEQKNMLENYAVMPLDSSPFSLPLYCGYLGDNAPNQNFSFSDIVFNFEMIISYRFEKDGYIWYSDGKYAFSMEKARETMVRIVGLLIEDLEREIGVLKGEIEFVEGSSTSNHMSHDADTEPTGL